MTQRQLIFLAAAGSLTLLAGAFVFQAIGYAPCKMCYWQRYPHAIAVGIGILALIPMADPVRRGLIILGGAAAGITGAIGAFHAGVEQKWWEGPSSCTGGGAGLHGLSGESLLATDVLDKVVMCDEVSWSMLGLSMPAWNAVFSIVLVIIWVAAWARKTT